MTQITELRTISIFTDSCACSIDYVEVAKIGTNGKAVKLWSLEIKRVFCARILYAQWQTEIEVWNWSIQL